MAGDVRKLMTTPPTEIFFPESIIMAQFKEKFLYGKIAQKIIEEIHSIPIKQYL